MFKEYFVLIFLSTCIISARCQTKVGDQCEDSYTGTVGTCKLVPDCPSAQQASVGNGVPPTFCAYKAFSPTLVCCVGGSTILKEVGSKKQDAPVWNDSDRSTKRVSVRKCEEYSERVVKRIGYIALQRPDVKYITTAKCDYLSTGLIVGGEKATRGEFPHMVAIGWTTSTGGYTFPCGASLISPNFILTAGHCIKFEKADPVVARLGDQNIDSDVNDGADPVDIPIKRILKHPEYNPPLTYNDIALMELASNVQFGDFIRPACLWTDTGFGGHTNALATGWGVIDDRTGETSKELLKVSLSLLENSFCSPLMKNFQNKKKWPRFIPSQMCAGELRGGKDTCAGDSGGPLQVVSDANQCIFYVMGVVSFGRYCAVQGHPGVYTRVASYLDWIEQTVWPGE